MPTILLSHERESVSDMPEVKFRFGQQTIIYDRLRKTRRTGCVLCLRVLWVACCFFIVHGGRLHDVLRVS